MRIVIFLLTFWIFSVSADSFLPGTEDIPLMEGLKKVEETASFDNPQERMVLISAKTDLSQKSVFNFYSQTLKNLGWNEEKPHYFTRGNDSFTIEILDHNQIQFRLSQSNF